MEIKEMINQVALGNKIALATVVFMTLMFLTSFLSALFFTKYLKDYKILQGIFAKIKGNTREYDRVRRMQIKQELEENRQLYYKDKKPSFISRLYATIAMTGVIEKVPGFSESAFFAMVIVLAVCVFGLVSWFKGAAVGGIAAVAFFIVVWYILSLLAYNRRIKLESQLLQFINACSSASMQYSSIIDIFGATYEQFKNPLRDALEECYVEAKQMNDKERAIRHLVEKFDSTQFAFVIDNLELCSSITGDYHGIAKDISETVAIYSNSHEKKKVLLRNAKINISIMFGMCIVILYMLSLFLGGLKDVLLNTFAGNVGIILLILMLFYSMNMKAEK